MINIIVAYDKNRVIGLNGNIPWNIKEDMKHFYETTLFRPVIMGRKTWESLKKPLSNRLNIVLTNSIILCTFGDNRGTEVRRASSIEEALRHTKSYYWDELRLRYCSDKTEQVFVVGGQQVYEQFLDKNLVDNIIATEINQEYFGDSFFPKLSGVWESSVMKTSNQFNIVKYTKVNNA